MKAFRAIAVLMTSVLFLAGCERRRVTDSDDARVTVCGRVSDEKSKPLPDALLQLHKVAQDTGDTMKDSYQITVSHANGEFVFDVVPPRQYWLAIIPKGGCEQDGTKRIPVIVKQDSIGDHCQEHWNVTLDKACDIRVN